MIRGAWQAEYSDWFAYYIDNGMDLLDASAAAVRQADKEIQAQMIAYTNWRKELNREVK
jgi:hypothetical protein